MYIYERDGLTRIVSTADRCDIAKFVLNKYVSGPLDAELRGQLGVGEVELAVGSAHKTSDGLLVDALLAWPLGFLESWRAGIRAHCSKTVSALAEWGISSDGGNDFGDEFAFDFHVLDTGPAANVHPVDGYRTIISRKF